MNGPNEKDCVISLLTKRGVAQTVLIFLNTRIDALQTGIDCLKYRCKTLTEKEVKEQMKGTIKSMEDNLADFTAARDTFQRAVSK